MAEENSKPSRGVQEEMVSLLIEDRWRLIEPLMNELFIEAVKLCRYFYTEGYRQAIKDMRRTSE